MPRLELNIEVDGGSPSSGAAGVGVAGGGEGDGSTGGPSGLGDGGGDGGSANQVHVTGTVKPEGGQERAFVGWVGLLALLQQALLLPPAIDLGR
jgi:hypothetical protein